MYGENRIDDAKRIARAVVTDQLARLAPRLYIQLTGQTGRGAKEESAAQIARYFRECFEDYLAALQVNAADTEPFLAGKRALEYGPGDVPAVAMLMVAHGAEKVYCVDRFPMVTLSPKNVEVLTCLLEGLSGEAKRRAESCFRESGRPASGLSEDRIHYLVRPGGLSGLSRAVDLVISRAVLEHVDDLSATFADMYHALRDGGISAHQVDLKSHGLHRRNPLDFLTWPQSLWQWMYGHKGVPNRWRVDRYRDVIRERGLDMILLEPTGHASETDVEEVRPYLAPPFRNLSDEDLSWLGFWLICRKPGMGIVDELPKTC